MREMSTVRQQLFNTNHFRNSYPVDRSLTYCPLPGANTKSVEEDLVL